MTSYLGGGAAFIIARQPVLSFTDRLFLCACFTGRLGSPKANTLAVCRSCSVQFAAIEVSTGGSALSPTPDVMSINTGLAEPSITESGCQQAHTCSAVSG